jgi:hypothetical protein
MTIDGALAVGGTLSVTTVEETVLVSAALTEAENNRIPRTARIHEAFFKQHLPASFI